jgi:hypothetical protein
MKYAVRDMKLLNEKKVLEIKFKNHRYMSSGRRNTHRVKSPFNNNRIYEGVVRITPSLRLVITAYGRLYTRKYSINYSSYEELLNDWNVLNRRMLIEKTGFYL